ncbi:glyoxalase [Serinibacter arcticus]|uniref:Glyoxalase n=1 Tax=Serinibacter arcticus TaxID=1655435 RepID=A0A2U1ZU95_9MICO|nr:VOC family protein [Serinibacter arcticus]PWD50555.1 glyoxalase [Serinibacter arcticus]
MAGIRKGWAGFAAPDLDAAEVFYRDVLGITVSRDHDMGMLTLHLDGEVSIYVKPDHEPAVFTVLTLAVADLDAAVDEIVGRGGSFARYDGFEQDERGIARGPVGPVIAWTADPAGNIVGIIEDSEADAG